jgi:hypothetical protein
VKTKLASFDRAALMSCFKVYTPRMMATGRFSMPASVWARTRSSRTRRSLIAGCGLMYSEDKQHLSKAKKAIAEYKRADGDPEGLAELMVSIASRRLDSVAMCAITIQRTLTLWCECSSSP